MLTDEERKDLVAYRIEKAWRVLGEARDNAKLGHWNLTGNRLYYSVFHMCQALLLTVKETPRRHAGMIHKMGQYFIMTGRIDSSYGRLRWQPVLQVCRGREYGLRIANRHGR